MLLFILMHNILFKNKEINIVKDGTHQSLSIFFTFYMIISMLEDFHKFFNDFHPSFIFYFCLKDRQSYIH